MSQLSRVFYYRKLQRFFYRKLWRFAKVAAVSSFLNLRLCPLPALRPTWAPERCQTSDKNNSKSSEHCRMCTPCLSMDVKPNLQIGETSANNQTIRDWMASAVWNPKTMLANTWKILSQGECFSHPRPSVRVSCNLPLSLPPPTPRLLSHFTGPRENILKYRDLLGLIFLIHLPAVVCELEVGCSGLLPRTRALISK